MLRIIASRQIMAKRGQPASRFPAVAVSMIVEQAGGISSTGYERILDIAPTGQHQRVPVILGSKNEVEVVLGYHKDA